MELTFEKAKELIAPQITEEHLIIHSLNVCYAMAAMAKHFLSMSYSKNRKVTECAGIETVPSLFTGRAVS